MMQEFEFFADSASLRAIATSGIPRGMLRLVAAEGAAFVAEAAAGDSRPLEGSAADPPSWTKEADVRDAWLPWVRVDDSILDAIVNRRLTADALRDALTDGDEWLPRDEFTAVVIEDTAVALVVNVSSSDNLYYTLIQWMGKAESFTSRSGSTSVDGLTFVIGVGAVGSHVAQMLPGWGFRRMVLVDRERLTRNNITVHLCGTGRIGQSKAKAVAATLHSRFEDVRAIAIRADIAEEINEWRDLIGDAALMVVAVDDPVVRHLCNHLAVSRKIPAVFVGMFHRGLITEVAAYRPGGACLNCVRLAVEMIPPAPDQHRSPSSYRGGLRTDVQLAGAMAARTAAALVHGPTETLPVLPGAVMYSSSAAIEDFSPPWKFRVPHQANWVPLPPDPSCRVCYGARPDVVDDPSAQMRKILGLDDG